MSNNNNAFFRMYEARNPGLTVTPFWEQYDSDLINNFCKENNIKEIPDYVSSAVIPTIKEYYKAKNLCLEAFLKYKQAEEAFQVAVNKNKTRMTNEYGNASSLKENMLFAFWKSEDVWAKADSAVRNAINASNEGTLGTRNIATSGLLMQDREIAEAALGAFSPRRAAVVPSTPAQSAAVPSASLSRSAKLQLMRARAQLKHLGRPPTNAEVAAELKKVQRFNAMQQEKAGRKGGQSRKSRKSRKNRKTRRT